MSKTNKIIALQCPVTIQAEEGEGKGPASFSVVAYDGSAMMLGGWDKPVIIDIGGLKFSRNVVANLDHQDNQRVGHVTDKSKADNKVTLGGVFSASTPYRQEVVESSKGGFEWEASVEVSPSKIVELAAGKTAVVNGQEFTGPAYITRTGTLSGFAFVSHGACLNTDVKIAATAAQTKGKSMKKEVKDWIVAMLPNLDIDALSDEEVANLEADYEGREGKRKQTPIVASNPFEAEALEAKRRVEVGETARKWIEARRCVERGDQDEIDAVHKMHDWAIEQKMSATEFKTKLYESTIPTAHTVHFTAPQKGAEISNRVIEAAICMQGGLAEEKLDAAFSDKERQTAHDRFKHGIGLKQLFRMAAKQNGYDCDHEDVTLEMQRAAFRKPERQIRAAHSTVDLSSVLANVGNKFLLEGWGGGEEVWRLITDIVSVKDFKQASFFKLSGNMKYKKINPGGQIEHGQVSTDSYTVQAETYGIMFGIDRTAIINDDLSVITRIPLEFGFGANDAFNEVFWTEFLDNASFFTGGNGNSVGSGILTGTTGVQALIVAEAAFLAQTKPNGRPLGILPTVLLVPPGYKRAALNLMQSSNYVGATSGPMGASNTFAGNYTVGCSAYIANAAFSGSDTKQWYLLCNRPGFSTMLTAFLFGRQTPTVETANAMFDELGVQMRAYHDFAANKMEYRAGVMSSGDT